MWAIRLRVWRITCSLRRVMDLDFPDLSLIATDLLARSPMIRFTLRTERLGPLPLINHFIQRVGLEDALDRYVPSDARCVVPHARHWD
jgi:hypothetical protein